VSDLDQLPGEMTLLDYRRKGRAVVRAFVAALDTDDVDAYSQTASEIAASGIWGPALGAAARHGTASSTIRKAFLGTWLHWGDDLRSEVNNDLVLLGALRVLLPPYDGPGLTLYRGDSFFNRRRRCMACPGAEIVTAARVLPEASGKPLRAVACCCAPKLPPTASFVLLTSMVMLMVKLNIWWTVAASKA
jgi:hypothetical protein